MAKLSLINREAKRMRTVQKYASKRAELKAQISDQSLSADERLAAMRQLQRLPRDASPVVSLRRVRVMALADVLQALPADVGDEELREAAMAGDVPGLVKASW